MYVLLIYPLLKNSIPKYSYISSPYTLDIYEARKLHTCNYASHAFQFPVLLLLLSIAERGCHGWAGLSDVHTLLLPILRLPARWDVLWLDETLVLVTPEHEVKEVGNEGGRDVVGRSMLGSTWAKIKIKLVCSKSFLVKNTDSEFGGSVQDHHHIICIYVRTCT